MGSLASFLTDITMTFPYVKALLFSGKKSFSGSGSVLLSSTPRWRILCPSLFFLFLVEGDEIDFEIRIRIK